MKIGAQDITLACKDCLEKFLFTIEEQDFFAKKRFSIPKRCKQCRIAKRSRHTNPIRNPSYRQMYEIICAQCGRQASVPFKPLRGRPVYCKLCYQSLVTSKQKV